MTVKDNRHNKRQQAQLQAAQLAAIQQHTEAKEMKATPVVPAVSVELKVEEAPTTVAEATVVVEAPPAPIEVPTTVSEEAVAEKEAADAFLADMEIIKEWIMSQDITFNPVSGLNFHTITAEDLVSLFNLPKYVPQVITDILLVRASENDYTRAYAEQACGLINMLTEDDGLNVVSALNIMLPLVRNVVSNKVVLLNQLLMGVCKFITPEVVEDVVESEPKAETKPKAKEPKPKAEEVKGEETDGEEKAKVVIPTAETELKEWSDLNPDASFDEYFDKRAELIAKHAA